VVGGRVFTLGVGGILSCLDARTGRLLWRKDTGQHPVYGASASPVVDNGLCITNVGGRTWGGLTAFDVATGERRWSLDDGVGGPSYSSPVLVELAGERQVVALTQANVVGVSAASGKLLWQVPLSRFDLEKCLTPIQYRDRIVFAGCREPLRAIRLEKGSTGITPRDVWKATGPTLHMSTPVLAGGWLVGFSDQKSGHLFCLDAATGRTLWRSEGRLGGYASILNAGRVWLVLTNAGRLIVVKPSATAYEPIAEYRVADTHTDAHPVLLGDRILIRDASTLRSFRIEQGPVKP
jgi:outer membrane protein assembly factor BamB